VLECVGTEDSLRTAVQLAEDGGCVGYVGVPHGVEKVFISDMFRRNLSLKGGIAPARHHIEELLPCVLEGRLRPGRVFDLKLPLGEAATAYKAMHERTAIKVMLETHR
jgi:threonine dehydrogenase-like Zn-dependent dehydrogenase